MEECRQSKVVRRRAEQRQGWSYNQQAAQTRAWAVSRVKNLHAWTGCLCRVGYLQPM